MSLLESGEQYEPITLYLEVTVTDADGNTLSRPSPTGTPALARFQLESQSGTSSRRREQDSEGFESETIYTMRLPRSFVDQYGELGAQTVLEWGLDSLGRPARWGLYGDVMRYHRSRRTRNDLYWIRRA